MGNSNHQQEHQHQHQHQQINSRNEQPVFIKGRPSPKYIRSITFENLSKTPLSITTTHKSNYQETHNLAGMNTLKVDKQIQRETCTLCDPILHFRIIAQDGRVVFEGADHDTTGIEARHYMINQDLTCSRKNV